jgi:hypothetical protein
MSADGDEKRTTDEAREKFRAALERKKGAAHGEAHPRGGPAAAHPHTAPAKPQRTFRRKSG